MKTKLDLGNLWLFHTVTLVPLVVICSLFSFKIMNVEWFTILMLFYAFVFRPLTDYNRLKSLGIKMDKGKFWKTLGLTRFRYYKELMFGK